MFPLTHSFRGRGHGDFVQTPQQQEHMTESIYYLVVDRKQREGRYRKRLGPIELPSLRPPVASCFISLPSANNAVVL